MKLELQRWAKHAAFNLGQGVASLYYAVLPPRITGHTDEELESFDPASAWSWFKSGITGKDL